MKLSLVGISHRHASVEVRERVALSAGAAAALAEELAHDGRECVCLSTCNRTELYVVGADAEAEALEALRSLGGEEVAALAYRLSDHAAALHLFRVAAGLDSLVPGEGEILGQVRDAYEAGAAGPLLSRLFHDGLHAGKRARTQTTIAENPASVSSAGAALAQQVFGELANRRVLLVGAGKVGELAARSLVARGAVVVVVANRTLEHGEALAQRVGAKAMSLDAVGLELADVDVVVTCTSAPGFVIAPDDIPERKGRPLFFVDLAVPRDVDPAVNELDGCYVYDIDDLEAVVEASIAGRRREAERAEGIVAEEAERFRAWQASLDVVPTIASLRARAEEIRASELSKAKLSDDERDAVDSITTQILNKLLHLPTVRMKEAAAAADGVLYADAVRHLFGLEDER
ncbi:MAG: glutamyl-tRNA reductase [Gaiellaceae bacterium]